MDKNRDGIAGPSAEGCIPFVQDLTAQNASEAIVEAAQKRLGPIDILINNTGIGNVPTLHETSDETFDLQMEVSFGSTFRLTKACIPDLIERRGCVVSTASVAGVS